MSESEIDVTDVDGAREEIFKYIQRYGQKFIYFEGWNGFGAVPVLRSIAQVLPSIRAKNTPPELCYEEIIYVDCSAWISKREMQRKIAEQLELDRETMALFRKQDEDDDFNCVDRGSRDVIPRVSNVISGKMWSERYIIVFLNGSDDVVDLNKFGFSLDYHDITVVWAFKRRFLTMHGKRTRDEIAGKLKDTRYRVLICQIFLTASQFRALMREEAATIVACDPCLWGTDLTMVIECCLYEFFLHYSFHGATGFEWAAHASNYWMCASIIHGDRAREITDALHHEICWKYNADLPEHIYRRFMENTETPFLLVNKDDGVYELQTTFARASSFFVAFENSKSQQRLLPNRLFEQCSDNLHVLTLYWCTFSFTSPPFLKCHKLRFLGLDHSTDSKTSKEVESTKWAFLHKLWVLDIRYTHWDEIITEDKMDHMANLQELNIEGFCCWQYISKLQGRLPNIQRLRIIKPTQQAETSVDSSNSFMDKTKLKILDLSGNRDMKNLPANLSKASSLEVLILDGCDGLENVILPDGFPSSLRSFSFDGYELAPRHTPPFERPLQRLKPQRLSDENKRDVKTSTIQLQGCTQLESLFVRGLPNLEELDLSGSPIKVLDFTNTMVLDVPRLKRLFLLGCQHLRAIQGTYGFFSQFEIVCLDTRPGTAPGFTRPSHLQQKSLALQLHAILADARQGRSLWRLLYHIEDLNFNIRITSSTENGRVVQLEETNKEMNELTNQWYHAPEHPFGDVFTEIIGDTLSMAFPRPPTQLQLGRHIEICDETPGLESELEYSADFSDSVGGLMTRYAESLHVHDVMTSAITPRGGYWESLKWCRVERCPNLDNVFPPRAMDDGNQLETIWASDLLMARSIWSKGSREETSFGNLQHLHLRRCPRLQFVLPVWVSSFPNLQTIHIIHCGDLRHVFVLDERYPEEIDVRGVLFPKLTTIHLHDLPKLQRICEVKMLAPALETIRIRGCWNLRRLPALEGREKKKPAIEIEKDVWDALEWDGPAAGHHPNLYEAPLHSRYYRRRRLLRGTVLR